MVAITAPMRWVMCIAVLAAPSNVPPSYCFELFSLAKIDVDYSQFTYKEKDQFFTPTETCQYCLQKTTNILAKYNDDINEYCFIEPSV